MDNNRLGVVVGRFQVPALHIGHRLLLDTARQENSRLLVILAEAGSQPTDRNPLSVESRKQMILADYPSAIMRVIRDTAENAIWDKHLDLIIAEVASGSEAIIYGSRDSFVPFYEGTLQTRLIEEIPEISGTKIRELAKLNMPNEPAFREGILHSVLNRFPTSYQTVDVIVHRRETGEILLGRKPDDDGWRFIGGFVDPKDESIESAAKRECYEETSGIEIGNPEYAGSLRIDDFRYRRSSDAVLTAVFIAPYIFGCAKAGDDLSELRWIPIGDVERMLIKTHQPVWKQAKQKLIP